MKIRIEGKVDASSEREAKIRACRALLFTLEADPRAWDRALHEVEPRGIDEHLSFKEI